MEVPPELASAEPLEVSGSNPRTWNRPIGFGSYRTSTVREGVEFSWSVEAFGVRGGQARAPYRLVLEGPGGSSWEVECRTRSIEAWRGGWSLDLTELFAPRLVCGVSGAADGRLARLVLGSKGYQLRGVVHDPATSQVGPGVLTVRSVHRLEGTRVPSGEPAGYVLERDGRPIAAVEVLNRGRVWLAPYLDAGTSQTAAATVAALLLFRPELSAEASAGVEDP